MRAEDQETRRSKFIALASEGKFEAVDRMAAAFARLGDLWRKGVRTTLEAAIETPPSAKH